MHVNDGDEAKQELQENDYHIAKLEVAHFHFFLYFPHFMTQSASLCNNPFVFSVVHSP